MAKRLDVLIIEEDLGLRSLLVALLGKQHHLKLTDHIHSAWQWLQTGNIPDVIIADMDVKNKDVIEFIRGLEYSSFYEEVKLIILGSELDIYPKNVIKMINKPIEPTELKETIKNLT